MYMYMYIYIWMYVQFSWNDTHTHTHTHTHTPTVVHTGQISLDKTVSDSFPPSSRPSLPLSGHRLLCRLRRAACLLYQSEPLAIVHARLEVRHTVHVHVHVHVYMQCVIIHVHVHTGVHVHALGFYLHLHTEYLGTVSFLLLVSSLPQVEIESGRLLFRRDLSPAADVGLRQDMLDMLLLNYSHVWLRIGLEVHVHVHASLVCIQNDRSSVSVILHV